MPAQAWIDKLDLAPHPEGGWYREIYRSTDEVEHSRFDGPRSACTSIYYLLQADEFSALHRIKSDEGWHHYAGDALEVVVIHPSGERADLRLGPGGTPHAVVPHGAWFGSRVAAGGGWALVGCTVSPGFDFQDFEMAERERLIRAFPQHTEVIHALTRTEHS